MWPGNFMAIPTGTGWLVGTTFIIIIIIILTQM